MLEAMRPHHWVKNAFVLAPILFSGKFADPQAWCHGLITFAAFCLASSSVYLINDLCDRQADQAHPEKRTRAVASGRLSMGGALVGAMVLTLAAAGVEVLVAILNAESDSDVLPISVVAWTAGYLVLNLLYSLWLKQKVILDVLIIALGFVLRATAGAAAIMVPISPWLVVCTFTFCLFIAIAKRRSEVIALSADVAAAARRTSRGYDAATIEHMLTVSTAVAVMTYCVYCLAPSTVHRVGSAHMVWTIPLMVYGMFRYYLLSRHADSGDPVRVVLRDRVLWLVVALYLVLTGLIIRFGSHETLKDILTTDVTPN